MTILVGYPTNRRAKAVLSLAGMLARSSGEDVVVCTRRRRRAGSVLLRCRRANLRGARADGVHIAYAADATLATLRVVR